jgi:hypothetical protein
MELEAVGGIAGAVFDMGCGLGSSYPCSCTAILTALPFGRLREYERTAAPIFRMRIPRISMARFPIG